MKSPPQLVVTPQLAIPRDELQFSFVRSSGPGGQHVNKVNTKAVLRWNASESPSLPDDVRRRFLAQAASRINDAGEVVITSGRHRQQRRNVADCLDKLRALLLAAWSRPVPRKKTRPPRAARESRLRKKEATAQKKQRRRPPGMED